MKEKGSPKTGGRKKGTPNKSSLPLRELSEKLGVDPFQILLHFASGDWQALGYESKTTTRSTKSGETYEIDIIEPAHRLKAASEACQYLHPKLRSVEHSEKPDPNADRELRDCTDAELEAMYALSQGKLIINETHDSKIDQKDNKGSEPLL